jgi:hypothetical protein
LWLAAAARAVVSLGVVVYNITQLSFRQAITPDRLLALDRNDPREHDIQEEGGHGSDTFSGDVHLLDGSGQVVASALGLRFPRAPTGDGLGRERDLGDQDHRRPAPPVDRVTSTAPKARR